MFKLITVIIWSIIANLATVSREDSRIVEQFPNIAQLLLEMCKIESNSMTSLLASVTIYLFIYLIIY